MLTLFEYCMVYISIFEYCMVYINVIGSLNGMFVYVRYAIHLWDLHHEGVWENRAIYVYYSELILEMSCLTIDFSHHLHMLVSLRFLPAMPLHNSDTVSVHFNHFYCMYICDKLKGDLAMLTYIYLNVDECWLASSMPQKPFNFKFLYIMLILNKMRFSWRVVNSHVSFKIVWVHITLLLP